MSDLANTQVEALGSAIRTRRKALRLTQLDVADLIGVTRQTVGRLETGDPTVSLGTAIAVAHTLGLSVLGEASH